MTASTFDQLTEERARVIGWRAAAQSSHTDKTSLAAAVADMERSWVAHLASGGDPGIETARQMFPGPWFDLWRACR